ncbi:hypothetical protein D3C87_1865540 [compost metagenome]
MHPRDGDPLPQQSGVHTLPDGLDDADRLAAADGGQGRFVAVAAADGPKVMIVDRRQRRADADLARARFRRWQVRQMEEFGRFAEAVVDQAAHSVSFHPSPGPGR